MYRFVVIRTSLVLFGYSLLVKYVLLAVFKQAQNSHLEGMPAFRLFPANEMGYFESGFFHTVDGNITVLVRLYYLPVHIFGIPNFLKDND